MLNLSLIVLNLQRTKSINSESKFWIWQKSDILSGLLIFSSAEIVAQIGIQEFYPLKIISIAIFAAFYYAWEVPLVFSWINKKYPEEEKYFELKRTIVTTLYYNPIWIFRHIFIINFFYIGTFKEIEKLIYISIDSFIYSLWLVIPANYLVQSKVKLEKRFFYASMFSLFMAIYYSLATILF